MHLAIIYKGIILGKGEYIFPQSMTCSLHLDLLFNTVMLCQSTPNLEKVSLVTCNHF